MAKEKKAEAKAEKVAEREFKYGVEDIAEALKINAASVRVKLRNNNVEKAGKSYGWNSKSDLKEVIDSLASEKPAKKEKPAKETRPAPKKEKPGKDKPAKKAKKATSDDDDED